MRVEFSEVRFVVAEDNPHMRLLLQTVLRGFGALEIYEAENGAEALQAIADHRPDVVITDWEMPVLNGLELTRIVRQRDMSPNPYLPIIMITGYSEKRRVLMARDAGVNEYLVKPLSVRRLYERILTVVASPRPFIRTKSYFGPDRRRFVDPAYEGPERRKDRLAAMAEGDAPTRRTG